MAFGTPTLGTVTKSNSDSTPTLNLPSHSTGDLVWYGGNANMGGAKLWANRGAVQ